MKNEVKKKNPYTADDDFKFIAMGIGGVLCALVLAGSVIFVIAGLLAGLV